jgi:acyl carrier protein
MPRPSREEALAKVQKILIEDFSIPPDKITAEATFRGSLGMDSLDAVDLIFFVESAFGYKARVHDYRDLHSVGALVEFVLTRTASLPDG